MPVPVVYEGTKLPVGYRIDVLVGGHVVIEVKAVDALPRVAEAQLLTYMKLAGKRLGYILNFNVNLMKDGISRRVL